MSTNLDAALDYLSRGWLPVPLCWPDENGQCACGRREPHEGKAIGKAPKLTGYLDLRPTERDVRRWWGEWPKANIGILLEPSKLLVVEPDNEDALQEAAARGLPPGPVVRSGRGWHYYYQANGAAGRTTKQGESHELDVLAAGIVVAPPSRHRSGFEYAWALHPNDAEPQTAPDWAVKLLLERPSRTLTAEAADEDEPPVDLDDLGRELWAGRLAVDKADGKLKLTARCAEVDRSETLYALGCRLAEANATSRTIIAALAERDRALGLDKYADRRDAGETEYRRIAAKALDRLMDRQPAGVSGKVLDGRPDTKSGFRTMKQQMAS